MRTDMDSMNPGKAMAQANHAASAFVSNAEPGYNVDEDCMKLGKNQQHKDLVLCWCLVLMKLR